MKKKLNKLDFLEINRRMNNNFNGSWQFMVGPSYKAKKGDLLKLERKRSKGGKKW